LDRYKIEGDINKLGVQEWKTLVQDRVKWKEIEMVARTRDSIKYEQKKKRKEMINVLKSYDM